MSDLLNSASLVLIPSGYKEDTVYSVVPSDGSGDLSFTRASNGTRVNSAGLVEVVPWNISGYSEDFGNVYWDKGQVTITSDAIVAPNGTITADKICDANNSNTVHLVSKNMATTGGTYTASVYMKKGDYNYGQVHAYDYAGAIFDLVNGTVISSDALGATITSIGDGWFRCTYSFVALNQGIFFNSSKTSTSGYGYTGTTGYGIYAWGYQLNIGSTAKPYFPTTDRLNVPRLTYQNGGGGCPSLLLEKQSTNDFTYSEEFDNAAWVKVDTTITANTTISPDGTQNADTMTTTAGTSRVVGNILTGAGTFTISCYVKRLTGNDNFQFRLVVDGANQTQVFAVTDEWQRFTFTVTAASSVTSPQLRSAGAGTGTFAIWGAQFEASSYPTSYIPTTSASATRVADACSKTGISSLIGQSQGTMFIDTYVGNETDEVYGWLQASLSGNPNDSIQINRAGSNVQCQVYNGGTVDGIITGGTIAKGQRIKIAVGYKQNDLVLYLNGTQIGVDTSTNIPTCAVFQLGAYPPLPNDYTNDGGINQAVLFKTRLTNAELASLTTL